MGDVPSRDLGSNPRTSTKLFLNLGDNLDMRDRD